MNKTNLLTATAAILLLVGCSNDESRSIPSLGEERVSLNVTGGIRALTRAHDAAWDQSDEIGIFMFDAGATTISEEAENRKYVTTDKTSNFKPVTTPIDQTIYFPTNGKTDFYAYYPWQAITKNTDGKRLYAVNVDVQTSQKAIDLMAADKVADKDKDNKDVAFEFTHKLVKIVLTEIKNGEGMTADELKGLTIKLTGQRTKATYDVIAGGNVAVNEEGEKAEIPLLVATDSQSAEAIVLPTATTEGMELVFTLTNGQVFHWAINSATDSKSKQLDANKKYSYKITISRRGLTVTSAVNDWTPGNGEEGEANESK